MFKLADKSTYNQAVQRRYTKYAHKLKKARNKSMRKDIQDT